MTFTARCTDKEPAYIFFTENFNKFNTLLDQLRATILTKYGDMDTTQQDFIIAYSSSLIYLFLDVFLNDSDPDKGSLDMCLKRPDVSETLNNGILLLKLTDIEHIKQQKEMKDFL